MIRKVIISLLTLAALATWVLLINLSWGNDFHLYSSKGISPGMPFRWKVDLCNTGLYIEHNQYGFDPNFNGRWSCGAYYYTHARLGFRTTNIYIPLWLPLVLFSAYPTIAFFHSPNRRYRRRKKGLCLTCGYDLTGNVSGICPECGERI